MSRSAARFAALALLAGVGLQSARGADIAPIRATPARPVALTPLPITRISGTDYVAVADLAKHLGLKFDSVESGRKVALGDGAHRAAIEADGREMLVNGLRIFLGEPARARSGQIFVSRIDAERCLTPLLKPGFGVALPAPPKIIAIDPGHGGKDEGAENKKLGLKEKNATLDVALRLKKLLEAVGYQVVLTRTDDRELAERKDVDLPLRAEIANQAHADLFVSIHFNSLPNDAKTSGSEIYTFSPQSQRSSNSWGNGKDDSEPAASPVNRFDHWNVVLAQAVHRNVLSTLKTFDRGKKINQLGALRRLECPGVLVESAFLSNDTEARRVAQPAFRQQIAEAIAAGVRDYAATLDLLRPK